MNEKISTTVKDRITWIDVARGILIVLVVMGHVKSSYYSSGILENSFVLHYSNVLVYSFHMAAFFFVSGLLFVQHRPNKKLSQRIVDKLISYGIPYVIFSFFYYVMQILLSVCLFCVNTILITLLKDTGYGELTVCDLMNFYMYFAAGIYFGKTAVSFFEEIKHKRWLAMGMSLVLAACALFEMYVTFGIFGDVLLACFGFFTVIIVSQAIGDCKVFRYFGKQSMPIYYLYGYAISFVRIVLTKLNANKFVGVLLIVVQ